MLRDVFLYLDEVGVTGREDRDEYLFYIETLDEKYRELGLEKINRDREEERRRASHRQKYGMKTHRRR